MKTEQEQISSLLCVKVALMYMMRPNCHMLSQKPRNTIDDKRWQSHLNFIGKIFDNLILAGIRDGGELYNLICARVVLACGGNPKRREELLSPVLDAIDYLLKELRRSK